MKTFYMTSVEEKKQLFKAYLNGETIQAFFEVEGVWKDLKVEPSFIDNHCYRVKPRFKIRKGHNGRHYAVFYDPLKAQDLAEMLGVCLHCFDGFQNSVLVEDAIEALEGL